MIRCDIVKLNYANLFIIYIGKIYVNRLIPFSYKMGYYEVGMLIVFALYTYALIE